MSKTIPFAALLPDPAHVSDTICPPYDVIESDEARRMARGNRYSFLHVTKSEIDLPVDMPPYDDEVYERAAGNLAAFQHSAVLRRTAPSYYIYRIMNGDHIQTGIVCGVSVDEYENGTIRQHEKTREEKVVDRMKHSLAIGAHAEPVFLVHRLSSELDRIKVGCTSQNPLYDATDDMGVRHILWKTKDTDAISAAFARLPALYIADGHHRSASAARVRDSMRSGNPDHTGEEPYNYFPAAVFPEDEVRIHQYDWTGDPKKRPLAKVSISDVMDLADRGGIMPPKQTWFQPKLASGLFVYPF